MPPHKNQKPNLGQHFLTSKRALAQIIEAADLKEDDVVLEIGPGEGILTEKLLESAGRVVAVEKDSKLVAHLRKKFQKEIEGGQLALVETDIRNFDTTRSLPATRYKLVANIPYYITGELLRTFLESSAQPERIVFLVQKEVAERIARSAKESILSLSVKAYGTPYYGATVPRGAFSPPPDIDSAILIIKNISKTMFSEIPEHSFFKLIKTGFSQKRKQLQGNLRTLVPEKALDEAFKNAGIAREIRAENVHLEEWVTLTRTLAPHLK